MGLASSLSTGSCLTGCRESVGGRWGCRGQKWAELESKQWGLVRGAGRWSADGCAVLDSVYMWVIGKPVHDALEKHNNDLGVMMQKGYTPTLGMRSKEEAEARKVPAEKMC